MPKLVGTPFKDQSQLLKDLFCAREGIDVLFFSNQLSYLGHVYCRLLVERGLVKRLRDLFSEAKEKTTAIFKYQEDNCEKAGYKKVSIQFHCNERDLDNSFRPFVVSVMDGLLGF